MKITINHAEIKAIIEAYVEHKMGIQAEVILDDTEGAIINTDISVLDKPQVLEPAVEFKRVSEPKAENKAPVEEPEFVGNSVKEVFDNASGSSLFDN